MTNRGVWGQGRMLVLLPVLLWGMMACSASESGGNAASDTSDPTPPAAEVASQPEAAPSGNADFQSFLRNFPALKFPHQISPKDAELDAMGETAQAISPGPLSKFLERDMADGNMCSAYGHFQHAGKTIVIFSERQPQANRLAYFARSFTADGAFLAETQIAGALQDRLYSYNTYAEISSRGKIMSHEYQSVLNADILYKETLKCQELAQNGEFTLCELPAGALFLGRFRSPESVDPDGGHDVWTFTTYRPKGESELKVALSRCYENGDGVVDECQEVGLVTAESFDGAGFDLTIDDVTGEMVPTYRLEGGSGSTWKLLVHRYDAASDSWLDEELHSQF